MTRRSRENCVFQPDNAVRRHKEILVYVRSGAWHGRHCQIGHGGPRPPVCVVGVRQQRAYWGTRSVVLLAQGIAKLLQMSLILFRLSIGQEALVPRVCTEHLVSVLDTRRKLNGIFPLRSDTAIAIDPSLYSRRA